MHPPHARARARATDRTTQLRQAAAAAVASLTSITQGARVGNKV